MKIERSVTVNVEAAHCDANGRMHGHSYLVQCWTDFPCCLTEFENRARIVALRVDHTVLENSIGKPSMEALGEYFMDRTYGVAGSDVIELSRVVVTRPTLGYAVEIRR